MPRSLYRSISLLRAVATTTVGCERLSSLVARQAEPATVDVVIVGDGLALHRVRGGNVRLIDALADSIGREKILLNRHVTHVESGADGVRVVATDTGSFVQQTVAGKCAVMTIPLYRLSDLQFNPPLSDEIRQAIATQTWGSYFTAHVFLDRPFSEIASGALAGVTLPLLSDGPLGVVYPMRCRTDSRGTSSEWSSIAITLAPSLLGRSSARAWMPCRRRCARPWIAFTSRETSPREHIRMGPHVRPSGSSSRFARQRG